MSEKYGCHKSPSEEYEIFICNSEHIERYYITFKDVNDLLNEVEISEQVYFEFLKSFRVMNNHHWRSWYHSTITGLHENMTLSTSAPSVEDIVIRRELIEEIEKIISTLPSKQRRRFILYCNFGLSYSEIAKKEGCTIMAVKISIAKAKKRISRALNENC